MIGKVPPFADCDRCSEYADRRGPKVMPAILARATRLKMRPARLARFYFVGVHERHLSGKSL